MEEINHECYVSHEMAKMLKEAGFDWEDYFIAHDIKKQFHWEIPLHIAQRWLREVQQLHITIFSSSQESWMFRITKLNQKWEDRVVYGEGFDTYEDAQEAGIQKCLTILLEEKK